MNKEFEDLLKYLKLALDNINNNYEKISNELISWKSEIGIEEVKEGLELILENITKWFKEYQKTNNILCISLKEYDIVSKESVYILGETALINELYTEIIDWIIGEIGQEMCNKLREGV